MNLQSGITWSDAIDSLRHAGRAREAALMTGRTFAGDLRRAFANPPLAWNYVRRWSLLARYLEVPYATVKRYRQELLDDRAFQQHLQEHLADAHSGFSRASELYVMVRALKPSVVVETGVSSGVSSAHILCALVANGSGMLHSIDLPYDVGAHLEEERSPGWFVPESFRARWELLLGDSRVLLPRLLAKLDHIDLFFHDGDHSYESMSFEFEQARTKLRDGGVLACDDSTIHTAWDNFCAKHQLSPNRIVHMGVTRARQAEATMNTESGQDIKNRQGLHIELGQPHKSERRRKSVRIGHRQLLVRHPIDDVHREDFRHRSGHGRSGHREFQVAQRGDGLCDQKKSVGGCLEDEAEMHQLLTEAPATRHEAFKAFVAVNVEPFAEQWDREERIPDSAISTLARCGYLGCSVPQAYGGQGWDVATFGLLNEALGRGSSALTGVLTVQAMVSMALLKWGTEAQRRQWLPPLAKGEMIGAFALTEPGAGSALESLATEFVQPSRRAMSSF